MRFTALALVLTLVGCLGTGPHVNPMKRKKKEKAEAAPVATATAAPVGSSAAPAETPELPTLTRVQAMKEAFLARKKAQEAAQEAHHRFFRLANGLTPDELKELNEWLHQFGIELKRKEEKSSEDERRVY